MKRTLRRRVVDGAVARMVEVGVMPGPRHLLTVRGRRTGRSISTPVTVVDHDGVIFLVAPYGEVSWVLNARARPQVTLSRAGRVKAYLAHEMDRAAAQPVTARYARLAPHLRRRLATATDPPPVFRLTPQ